MEKMFKRLVSGVLSIGLIFSMCPNTFVEAKKKKRHHPNFVEKKKN